LDSLKEFANTTGSNNTACGLNALLSNTTGSNNTGIGIGADVSARNLTNATAIGNGAIVNASNKIRLGNPDVTVIEGWRLLPFRTGPKKKTSSRWMEKKYWERFVALR
jgi:hypothetical protein